MSQDGVVSNISSGPDLEWLLHVVLAGLVAVTFFFFYVRKRQPLPKIFRRLSLAAVATRVIYATFLTLGKYYFWSKGEFTKHLLDAPLSTDVPVPEVITNLLNNRLGYFLFYSYGRFWLNVLITILVAVSFYALLKVARKSRDRFFKPGEVELGLLSALIVGWPNVAVFIPLVFVMIVMVSVFRLVVLKKHYTSLGEPLLFAAVITMIFGSKLVSLLRLGVLRV